MTLLGPYYKFYPDSDCEIILKIVYNLVKFRRTPQLVFTGVLTFSVLAYSSPANSYLCFPYLLFPPLRSESYLRFQYLHFPYLHFPVLTPTLYLQPFSKYWALNILGSWPSPFKVTWHHRSRDDSIPHMQFPVGAPLEPSPYLEAFSRYSAPKRMSNANRHCAWATSRDLYPLCKIWVHIWISHPHIHPIHYDTFIGLRWRIRGVYSLDPQC